MNDILVIETKWEQLGVGSPEERACFAAIGIRHGPHWLTEADDQFVNRVREQVPLSTYRLAEWVAWNWWRLRWEPRRNSDDWALAHRMSTIGGGYIWPNITVLSDGERIILSAKPTMPCAAEPIRYISDFVAVVRAAEFEGAIDLFIDRVRGQLRAEDVQITNLDKIWEDVLMERADPEVAFERRMEAMLGCDPDEADDATLRQLLEDAQKLGREGIAEVAADQSAHRDVPTAAQISELARNQGFGTRPSDAAKLSDSVILPERSSVPAWRRGAEAARALRQQEGLGSGPLSNDKLADLSGVSRDAIGGHRGSGNTFSFALDQGADAGRLVLRAKWETGRRFEVARLLGDRIAGWTKEPLLPATRAHTYRQRLQRSFAAELLCPFEILDDELEGDYSDESIEDAARRYNVSDRTVRTLLVNHGRLSRESIEDLERLAA